MRRSVWVGDDAEDPLAGTACATITHNPSIFSLLVFAPPLSRLNTGHYWSPTVAISVALTIILVTTQIGLTLIAGENIRSKNAAFKKALVRADKDDMIPEAMTPMGFVAGKVYNFGAGFSVPVSMSDFAWLAGQVRPAKGQQCCNGAECAAMRITCCDRSNVKIGSPPTKNASFLLAMSATQMEDSKPRYVGRSWDEICYRHDGGMLDCTPPSYLYMDAWDELDTNQDGQWSLEEAIADKANLGCRFGASASEMFRSACSGIEKDAQDTSVNSYSMPIVPTEIEKKRAIPKAYFQWWQALGVMCVTPDVHRCSALVKSGMFDGAIRMYRETEVSRGGIADLDTALDFCQRLLARNGICEKTLPGSYLMYRSRVNEKCGPPTYEAEGKYLNPYDKRDAMSIIGVNYDEYHAYQEGAGFEFQIFIFLILMVWYLSLMHELQSILHLTDFTIHFKVNGHSPILTPKMEEWVRNHKHSLGKVSYWMAKALLPTEDKSNSKECTRLHPVEAGTFWTERNKEQFHILVIESHSLLHVHICAMMCIVRLFLVVYMADVGTSFLMYTRDYSELLMNAVALAFIFKLPEFLYVLLVSDAVKDKLNEATCTPFPTFTPRGGWARFLLAPTTWGLTVIPLFTAGVVYWNLSFNTMPFLDALQCACYQQGSSCNVAPRFEKSWWDQYWQDNTHLAQTRASWFQG